MWQELDFVALGLTRTFIQFFLNESGEARGLRRESEGPRPADREITSEAVVNQVAEAYRNRVRQANHPVAMKAIDEHFTWVNANLRWVEKAKIDAEPTHLDSLLDFAARAWRRPLTDGRVGRVSSAITARCERKTVSSHEDAMRDSIVYRADVARLLLSHRSGRSERRTTESTPLSDFALASRLSYFLWSSMPDDELLAAAAGAS